MITALGTNVLLDILVPNEDFFESSRRALEDCWAAGSLVICDVVYAEISIHFSAQADCDAFFLETGIRIEPLEREAAFFAGRAWRTYRKRGGTRSRILPDFLIGAHATKQASQLLARDRGFYGQLFPALKILDPRTR